MTIQGKVCLPQDLLLRTILFHAGKQLLDMTFASRNEEVEKKAVPHRGRIKTIGNPRSEADDSPGTRSRLLLCLHKSAPQGATVNGAKHIGELARVAYKIPSQGTEQRISRGAGTHSGRVKNRAAGRQVTYLPNMS